jgi:protein TonB
MLQIAAPEIAPVAETAPASTPTESTAPTAAVAAASPAAAVEAPPAPRPVPSSALRYLVAPPLAFPPASRRLGESGTVVLRVVVDVQGLPKRIALQRSSGFARLDEQALAAMRQARFAPCTERGEPIECESNAALAYDLEN